MSKVSKCHIEECAHNKNKECHADGIEVKSSGTMSVTESDHTCCETFKPKGMY